MRKLDDYTATNRETKTFRSYDKYTKLIAGFARDIHAFYLLRATALTSDGINTGNARPASR